MSALSPILMMGIGLVELNPTQPEYFSAKMISILRGDFDEIDGWSSDLQNYFVPSGLVS